MKKYLVAMMIVVMCVGLFAACTDQGAPAPGEVPDESKSVEPDKSSAPLIMGTESGFPPFEFMVKDNVVGVDVAIMERAAAKLGRELKVEDMNFDSIIPALNAGKVDVGAAGMSVTPERLESVDFSNPYYTATQVIVVKADNDVITKKDDLKGKKVGVQLGTTGDEIVTGDKIVEDKNIERLTQYGDVVLALKSGKIDAIVMDSTPAKLYAKNNSDIKILDTPYSDTEEYGIAVKKGNKEVLDAVNETIESLKASGELDNIIQHFEELAESEGDKE